MKLSHVLEFPSAPSSRIDFHASDLALGVDGATHAKHTRKTSEKKKTRDKDGQTPKTQITGRKKSQEKRETREA